MSRIPDPVVIASLDTHRLVVAVPSNGPTEILTSLPRTAAASALHQVAAQLTSPAGRCDTAVATGRPCPVHDAPTSPSRALVDAGKGAAEAAARGMAQAQRPAGLSALLAHLAAAMSPDDDDQADALAADDVRDALTFNADDRDPALATLRDVLLDTTSTRTPDQALAAARIILTAHARQVAALIEAHHRDTRTRAGLTRSSRGVLTGYEVARKIVTAYADGLADEQALAEAAEREQATP
ncbi:hypothetical protein ACFW5V_17455 [Streptomyces sp. NPDC058762]|uniref:hypothetical protein n=1 Tax=Streptomyces sp. NPDC058762 TaxID=3346629 RepID=UPI0036A168BE